MLSITRVSGFITRAKMTEMVLTTTALSINAFLHCKLLHFRSESMVKKDWQCNSIAVVVEGRQGVPRRLVQKRRQFELHARGQCAVQLRTTQVKFIPIHYNKQYWAHWSAYILDFPCWKIDLQNAAKCMGDGGFELFCSRQSTCCFKLYPRKLEGVHWAWVSS